MSNYLLNINFTEQSQQDFIKENLKIVIGKPNADQGMSNVAWEVFQPAFTNNTIAWDDNYSLYASFTPVVEGALLEPDYTVNNPVEGQLYTFFGESEGFSGPGENSEPDAFSILNQDAAQPLMTFGLLLQASINSENAGWSVTSGIAAEPGQTIAMSGDTPVFIWAQTNVVNSMVEYPAEFSFTKVPFDETHLAFTVGWNPATKTFDLQ